MNIANTVVNNVVSNETGSTWCKTIPPPTFAIKRSKIETIKITTTKTSYSWVSVVFVVSGDQTSVVDNCYVVDGQFVNVIRGDFVPAGSRALKHLHMESPNTSNIVLIRRVCHYICTGLTNTGPKEYFTIYPAEDDCCICDPDYNEPFTSPVLNMNVQIYRDVIFVGTGKYLRVYCLKAALRRHYSSALLYSDPIYGSTLENAISRYTDSKFADMVIRRYICNNYADSRTGMPDCGGRCGPTCEYMGVSSHGCILRYLSCSMQIRDHISIYERIFEFAGLYIISTSNVDGYTNKYRVFRRNRNGEFTQVDVFIYSWMQREGFKFPNYKLDSYRSSRHINFVGCDIAYALEGHQISAEPISIKKITPVSLFRPAWGDFSVPPMSDSLILAGN